MPIVKLFKADWCGYCQKFAPEWEKLERQSAGTDITTEMYDVDQHEREFTTNGIRGYPTVLIEVGREKYKYTGERTAAEILKEVRSRQADQRQSRLRGQASPNQPPRPIAMPPTTREMLLRRKRQIRQKREREERQRKERQYLEEKERKHRQWMDELDRLERAWPRTRGYPSTWSYMDPDPRDW
jgi:thiol-disulfide isomerase/thioredoxin